MSDKSKNAPATPAMDRGSIDKGDTGEKVAGFDPAMAPMETDAEAGGVPTALPERSQMQPAKVEDNNSTAAGSAMRVPGYDDGYHRFRRWIVPIICTLFVGVVVVFLYTSWADM